MLIKLKTQPKPLCFALIVLLCAQFLIASQAIAGGGAEEGLKVSKCRPLQEVEESAAEIDWLKAEDFRIFASSATYFTMHYRKVTKQSPREFAVSVRDVRVPKCFIFFSFIGGEDMKITRSPLARSWNKYASGAERQAYMEALQECNRVLEKGRELENFEVYNRYGEVYSADGKGKGDIHVFPGCEYAIGMSASGFAAKSAKHEYRVTILDLRVFVNGTEYYRIAD